jgi:hypothetical protein
MRRDLLPSKTPYYTAYSLTTPLPSLSFVSSCFHLSSLLLSRSARYSHTIPSILRSCNIVLSTLTKTSSSTHHTSLPTPSPTPNIKFVAVLFLTLGPQRLKLKFHGLWPRDPLLGCSIFFICFRPWVLANSYQSSRRQLRVHTPYEYSRPERGASITITS